MTIPLPTKEQTAAYLIEPGRVELRRVPVPRPGDGQILLRIERALAGGTDRKAFARGHPQIPMPGPFGHRYAGVVAALGDDAPAFEVGQPVMGVHSAPCLECDLCRKGRQHLCPHVMREGPLRSASTCACPPRWRSRTCSRVPVGWNQNMRPCWSRWRVVHGMEMIDSAASNACW
jgi:hypothetical protein